MESFSTGSFLQGFLEEAAEHLENIHRCLLRIEEVDPLEQAELVDDLFRSFHTLKGLSGMVGLEEAASLSHAMETVLQAIRRERLTIDSALVDQLFASTGTLSAVIETLKDQRRAMPQIQPDLEKLTALTQTETPTPEPAVPAAPLAPPARREEAAETAPSPSSRPEAMLPGLAAYPDLLNNLSELDQRKIESELQAGQMMTLVVFVPSAQRAERGENVDLARQQLVNAGKLIKAVPVMEGGTIHFLFLVSTAQPLDAGTVIANEVIPLAAQLVSMPAAMPQIPTAGRAALEPGRPGREPVRGSQVRVGLDRLDALMRFAGDLVIERARLGDAIDKLTNPLPADQRRLREIHLQMGNTLRDLRRAILHARMVPLGEAFNQMPLVVRDLARASQKEVRLVVQGEGTELDKMLVERLLDPLIHLVRNAITHGIEPPAERVEKGKPRTGTLTLRGVPHGDRIIVEVSDDGRGVNLERVAARAAEMGRQEDTPMTAEEALDWIIRPGFSTQTQADLAAGRGVGLDVAARMVRAFGGHMSLETSPGAGTTFRLALPLTLVIQDVLFVRVGGERYGVSQDSIDHVIEIDEAGVVRAEAGEMLLKEAEFFVLHRLAEWFQARPEPTTTVGTDGNGAAKRTFGLVCGKEEDGSSPVLVVNRVENIREAVVAPLVDPLVARPGISGATEMGNGEVVLILDVPGLLSELRKE